MSPKLQVLPPSAGTKSAISAFMRAESSPDQQKLVIGYLLSELCNLNATMHGMDERETQRLLGRRDVALALMEISNRHQKLRFGDDGTD